MMKWLKRKFTSPSYPDPRDESPEDAKKRLTKLEWGVHAVGRKIERVYGVTIEPDEKTLAWALNVGKTTAQQWLDSPNHKQWLEDHSQLRDRVTEGVEVATTNYLKAFMLYKQITPPPQPRHQYANYAKPNAAKFLYDIYTNHLSNAVEARFIDEGVDPLMAHRLNGYILRHAIDVAHKEIHADAYVAPAQARSKPDPRVAELQTIEQVDKMRNYWTRRHRDLDRIIHPPER